MFILDLCVMRIYWTVFAGLLGLAFGSFLNVCLSRWPEGESVVRPRSRCRACGRTLTWWENVPVMSWLALRGRCRTCGAWIGVRYVVVELAVGVLWAIATWDFLALATASDVPAISPFLHWNIYNSFGRLIGWLLLDWLLIALATLDAEHLWLPDWLTVPGIIVGFASSVIYEALGNRYSDTPLPIQQTAVTAGIESVIAISISAALVLLIRWLYWLVRRKEGLGLGDAKLMAMLAAWLGLPGALLAFFIGVVLGALAATGMLLIPRLKSETWGTQKLPLGTFLCVGGIVSSLWGKPILDAYLRWAGF